MRVLVTGAAGYIGSHTTLALLESGYDVVAVDDLSNGSTESLRRVQGLAKRDLQFLRLDVRDARAVDALFQIHEIEAIIHFAAFKSVADSVADPLAYYANNLHGTLQILRSAQRHGVSRLVFSSSASIYGADQLTPIAETCAAERALASPYARTKVACEWLMESLAKSEPAWQIAALRYFNPVGAHPSGRIGESPHGRPTNLLPYITLVAQQTVPHLTIFGTDYDTPDGTGVRDYIHVCDLAEGHIAALEGLQHGFSTYNLGTGQGTSVLEAIRAIEKITGRKVPYVAAARRPGDVGLSVANVAKARDRLGWVAKRTFEEACYDAWCWQLANPSGYGHAVCKSKQ